MKSFAAVVLLILSTGLASSVAQAQSDDKTVVDKFISAQATREHGEEPDGIRKVVDGDLDHDGVADVAVLYTIEGQNGSNNYIQYLAVFLRKNGSLVYKARVPVGGKNHREIEITSIKDNSMLLNTTAYGPRDPSCCPTIKGKTKFVLVGNKLSERPQK